MYRGRGFRGRGRDRGRGRGPAPAETSEKFAPSFVKIKDLRIGPSVNLVVKVGEVKNEATRTERRGNGRTFTFPCAQAFVGDDTGSVLLSSRQANKIENIKEGTYAILLNVRLRRSPDQSFLDLDNWSEVKSLEEAKSLVPSDFNANFEINKDNVLGLPAKPVFQKIDSLEPEATGIWAIVKVLDVKVEERSRVDGRSNQVYQATIGDESASITLIARGNYGDVLKPDAIVAIFNAHIEMYDNCFMRLVADKWSDVKDATLVDKSLFPSWHTTPETNVNISNNKSQIEWVLQDES